MKRALGVVVTVLIGVGVITAVGVGFRSQKYQAPNGPVVAKSLGTAIVNGKSVPHVEIQLATWPDSTGTMQTAAFSSNGTLKTVPIHPSGNPGWPAYAPSNNFQVPAGALVTVKWDQYDSGGALNNPYFAVPRGTYGPVMVNGKAITTMDPTDVAHTFTVRPEPGIDSGFFLSVASPVNHSNNDTPNDDTKQPPPQPVEFSFISGTKGLYAWNCEFPCGLGVGGFGAVMGAYGFMSGYLHVV